jgi:hypothetical protein
MACYSYGAVGYSPYSKYLEHSCKVYQKECQDLVQLGNGNRCEGAAYCVVSVSFHTSHLLSDVL